MPFSAREEICFVVRAVAKTRKPREWKERAMAWPMPPGEQPVMRTVFLWVLLVAIFGRGLWFVGVSPLLCWRMKEKYSVEGLDYEDKKAEIVEA